MVLVMSWIATWQRGAGCFKLFEDCFECVALHFLSTAGFSIDGRLVGKSEFIVIVSLRRRWSGRPAHELSNPGNQEHQTNEVMEKLSTLKLRYPVICPERMLFDVQNGKVKNGMCEFCE
jgi:hypothetical protein